MKKVISIMLIISIIFSTVVCSGALFALADVAYGTKNNPLVYNENSSPIIVQGGAVGFPDEMQINDNAKFTGSSTGAEVFNAASSVSYSDTDGTYYGATAGSVCVSPISFNVKLNGNFYSAMQFRKELKPIPADSLNNSSIAFWIKAPADMFLTLHLFAYRHSGSSGDINFYSEEIKVSSGTNLIEIPLANFTVVSNNSVDFSQNLKIYATRFCFRNIENGEDISNKAIYVDNIGLYFNKNSVSDYKGVYGTQGNPAVENENNTPIIVNDVDVDFPSNIQIANKGLFTGNIDGMNSVNNSTKVSYSDTKNTYYGATAGSAAVTIEEFSIKLMGKNYSSAQLVNGMMPIPADKLANSSIAFWINAPEDLYLVMHLFAYRHSGNSGDIGMFSEEIKLQKGVNFVEIPIANFVVNTSNSIDFAKNLTIYATRFNFRSIENGEDILDDTIYVDNIGLYFDQNAASDYVESFGTMGNPAVKNEKNEPIIVNCKDVDFPSNIQISNKGLFTGNIDGMNGVSDSAKISYSKAKDTYYGATAGSAAITIEKYAIKLIDKYYSSAQLVNGMMPIPADKLANSSIAFWVNAPEDLYLVMHLFAYRHSGDSGDIGMYSEEIKLQKGVSFVEIPIANFIVNTTNSIDFTKELKIYATRFNFRNIENGEDITGKTVYVDNIGLYFDQNTASDYVESFGTMGNPAVENEKNVPIVVNNKDVDFPAEIKITNNGLFTGNIDGMNSVSDSTSISYSDTKDSYYGATAGSAAITIEEFGVKLINKNYSSAQLKKDLVAIPADKLSNSSIAFWINAPEEMYLVMHLFAYRHSGDSGDIGMYSEEIKLQKGVSFVEIPIANFVVNTTNSIDFTKELKIYATRFNFRNIENGEDITGKTVYVDNIGLYFDQNAASDYVESFGTMGNPVVDGQNNSPIVVQGAEKSFPEGMLINNNAKFIGSIEGVENVGETSVVSYSKEKDTYYGKHAGSIAAELNNFGIKLAGNEYSAMQFKKPLNNVSATVVKDASIAFWLNVPTDMYLRCHIFAYKHSGSSGDINFYSEELELKKGVNFVEIPFSNFIVNSTNSIDPTQDIKIYATRFCFRNIEGKEDITGKMVYVDHIGIYNKQNSADDYKEMVNGGEVEEPSVDGKALHNEQAYVENSSWQVSNDTIISYAPIHNSSKGILQSESNEHSTLTDFAKNYTPEWSFEENDLGWKEHNLSTFAISKSNEKSYSGSALKLFYDKDTAKDEFPRVLCSKNSVTTVGYDGIAVWVYSEQDTTLSCLGVMNNCGKTSQLNLTVKKGGQILLFPFEEFSNFDAFKGETKTISQLQFMGINFKTDITLYLDHVGLYKNDDMKAANANAYGGVGKSVKISTVADSIMPVGAIHRFDINFKSPLTDREKNKWGSDATLAIWIKTNRAVNVKVGAGASMIWKPATGENHWFSNTHTIPKGESILRIPLTEFVNKQNGWSYTTDSPDWSEYIGRLIFQISSLNDIELEMYIDQIAIEYPVKEVAITPEYLEDNTFVWWDFDQYEKVEDMNNDWETRWAGETNDGITLDIEKNTDNVYGESGNSLKLNYDSAFAEWGIPVVWHQQQMTVYGDGITFWFKSLENMEIDIYAAAVVTGVDKWPIVKVTNIPVKYGENVITVKYDDFVLDSKDGGEVPKFTKLAQLQIRLKKCTSGTAWLDSIGFSGVVNDGSNQYKFLNPPATYSKFENGVVSVSEDFENREEDDLDFCTDWYYEDTGWITLEKSSGSKKLRMDYDLTEKKSVLKNITYFEQIDPSGGISFWLKSSENRNYGVSMTIGGSNVTVVIKGTTAGKTYNIPFSAFWDSLDINKSFSSANGNLVTITRLEFATDSTYNPPANGASPKCSVWIDDIKFVDSLKYKRASSVDYTENGVRLIASAEAFSSGVSPKFSIVEIDEAQKKKYISQMKNVDTVWREFDLKAIDTKGVNAIPTRQVELIFDLPEDVNPENISVWQKYFDGSVLKINSKLSDDGKLHVQTYKLGNYILAYNSNVIVDSNEDTELNANDNSVSPIIVIIAVAVIVLISGVAILFLVIKKKGAGK